MITKKIEYEKLEYIHCALQEVDRYCKEQEKETGFFRRDCDIDNDLVVTAMGFVEDIRGKFFDKNGELIDEVKS